MKPFKHYILTRFNLGIYDPAGPYHKTVKTPRAWLKHRIQLFEKYTLPSVQRQTCQDFTWVLAFDPDTPPDIVCAYDYMDNVQVCFEQPHLWLRTQEPETEWLITSRFDNDDMYDPQFVWKIQSEFRAIEEVIDIDYHVFDVAQQQMFTSERYRANSPFLSLVERWELGPMTALGRPHTVMPDVYESRKLGVYATQIIHDRNVCNKVNGRPI